MADKFKSTKEFLAVLKPYVIADMKKSGILASLTASQAIIESRNGNSGLAQSCNNLFGIKGSYNGQFGTFWTTEYYNGVATRIQDNFRKYPSWAEGIADHSALFNTSKRYTNLRNLQDYQKACEYVKQDGYATSPTYTKTLLTQVKNYKLYEWDYEVIKEYPIAKLNVVKLNSRGGAVMLLQKVLGGLSVDGIFGQNTENAVKKFQENNNLTVDGIVGKNTWTKLLNK